MSWITITTGDVQTRLTGPEMDAFRTAATAFGQVDPLPEIIAQVVDEIRGYIAACSENRLGAAGTIPPRLLATAINIIRYRYATRLPGMSSLIDPLRVAEYNDALRLLQQVAACDFSIEDPDGRDGSATPMVSGRAPQFSRQQQDGI